MTYPQIDISSSVTLELLGKFPHTEVMVDLLIENVPAELNSAFKVTAKRSGLTLQEAVINALENYVENSLFDSRFKKLVKAKVSQMILQKLKTSSLKNKTKGLNYRKSNTFPSKAAQKYCELRLVQRKVQL